MEHHGSRRWIGIQSRVAGMSITIALPSGELDIPHSVMRVGMRLMPPAAAHRWRAEVASFLAECDPRQRRAAMWSWARGVPRLVAMMWVGELARRARNSGGRQAAGKPPQDWR